MDNFFLKQSSEGSSEMPLIDAYLNPTSMEPLLPMSGRMTLSKLTCDILTASGRLT
jgi:hypothetical protein